MLLFKIDKQTKPPNEIGLFDIKDIHTEIHMKQLPNIGWM